MTKKTLMDPMVDFVFKSIFGNEKHPRILISFLNAVFNYNDERKIVKVKIENPNIEKEDIEDKYSILDVKATANDNTIIDIEIQIRNTYDMIERTLYYTSKLIEGQVKESEGYSRITKTVTINILNFRLLNNNKREHNTFILKERETNEILTELIEIHFIEMPKFRRKKARIREGLDDWLTFIENPESEASEMLMKKVPEIEEARSVLEVLSMDDQAKAKYEMRQKALKDKVSSLEGARRKGIELGEKIGENKGRKEGLKEGIDKGIKVGLKEGIKDLLEIKFGEKGLELFEKIHKIDEIELLEKIRTSVKVEKELETIKKMVD